MITTRTTNRAGIAVALALVGAPLLASASYAAGSPPASPAISGIVSHNGALTASWTESSTGSITYKATATAIHHRTHSCTTKALKCTISSLVNGVTYSVAVVASNANGKSAPSTPVTATVGVPGAPNSVHATAGVGKASVKWAPPASSGVSAVTGYVATANPGGFSCSTTGTGRACTITGLTKGTTYSVSVVASNKYGSGPASKSVKVTSKWVAPFSAELRSASRRAPSARVVPSLLVHRSPSHDLPTPTPCGSCAHVHHVVVP